jgi:hypothetical protein
MANEYVTQWDYADKHVDSTIDRSEFLSSSRCIIYAAPYKSIYDATTGGQTNVNTAGSTSVDFKRIGVVQGWNWGENRQIEMIFELGSDIPYLVPGRTTGQISVSRILLFGKDLANMVYNQTITDGAAAPTAADSYIKSIKEINKPFDLMFAAYNNNDATKVYSRVFSGCWLQSKNESLSAGQILIAENVNIMYENIVSVKFATNG